MYLSRLNRPLFMGAVKLATTQQGARFAAAPLSQLRYQSSISLEPDNKKDKSGVHFKLTATEHPLGVVKHDIKAKVWEDPIHHSVWTKEEINGVKITHLPPKGAIDTVAYHLTQAMRFTFDLLAGFKTRVPNEDMYLNRIIFLETVAGIPGMVGAMVRHLQSLRLMRRDYGWIQTLFEEAENERMHLVTFLEIKTPSMPFRLAVLATQGVLFNVLFVTYLISPKFCHRLVGYIEEEAVKTYTHIIDEIDAGKLPKFATMKSPVIANNYWMLPSDATMKDLLLAVRADEANHREVNHTFATLRPDAHNPFIHTIEDTDAEVKKAAKK